MMKTITLNYTLLAATALGLGGCKQDVPQWSAQQDVAVCARNGMRVPDRDCSRPGGSGGGWYYYSRGRALPYYGDRVSGGSVTRTAGATYFHAPVETSFSRAAVSRGGFGALARGFGGFGE